MNFARIYYRDGNSVHVGSIKGERLDIGFSGGYMTVGRGYTCHFKDEMTKIDKVVFLSDTGPDVELSLKSIDRHKNDKASL